MGPTFFLEKGSSYIIAFSNLMMSDTAFKSDYDTTAASPLYSRDPAEPTYAVRRFQFSIDTTNFYKFFMDNNTITHQLI